MNNPLFSTFTGCKMRCAGECLQKSCVTGGNLSSAEDYGEKDASATVRSKPPAAALSRMLTRPKSG